MTNLIGTNANQVPTNGMLGTMAFVDAVDSITSTATTSTTLTSTATLLQITPSSYGVAVTLPDATTCVKGGPLHIIDNRGAYPVRVLNSAGTLLGFVYGGVVSHVSLADKSTAAGVWTVENSELVGASAQLLTANMSRVYSRVDVGSSRECLVGGIANGDIYGVVYDRSTNTFGSLTLIRTATTGTIPAQAILSATNQVLVVSCNNAAAFEAVTLSISGTTITVNTAATTTLSANANSTPFADGCGLIAVGSSFVCSYTVVTPAAQIRALSISGTTVTIGSAAVLDGTAGGLIALGDSTHVIAVSTATTHLYTKPYLISGSSLTAGTGTNTNSGTMTLNKLAALGTRWFVAYNDAGNVPMGGIVSLNATGNGTTTISVTNVLGAGAGTLQDAIIVGSNKVLMLANSATSNANILTDTAGTASAGTAITLSSQSVRACVYASGTDVVVQEGVATYLVQLVDCSGSSPVLTATHPVSTAQYCPVITASDSVLSRSPNAVFGTDFAQSVAPITTPTTTVMAIRINREVVSTPPSLTPKVATTRYRGKSASEVWAADGSTVITKIECVV